MGRGNKSSKYVPQRGGSSSPRSNPTLKLISELQADVARIKAAAAAGSGDGGEQGALSTNHGALKHLAATIEKMEGKLKTKKQDVIDAASAKASSKKVFIGAEPIIPENQNYAVMPYDEGGAAGSQQPSGGSRFLPPGKVESGKLPSKRILPHRNRVDAQALPPHLTESDLNDGLLNLTQRGFIPKCADVTPALERGHPAVTTQCAMMHDPMFKYDKMHLSTSSFPAVKMAPQRRDYFAEGLDTRLSSKEERQRQLQLSAEPSKLPEEMEMDHTFLTSMGAAPPAVIGTPHSRSRSPSPKPLALEDGSPPGSGEGRREQYTGIAIPTGAIVVKNGSFLVMLENFMHFKTKNATVWPQISTLLKSFEWLCRSVRFNLAFVDGNRFKQLAMKFDDDTLMFLDSMNKKGIIVTDNKVRKAFAESCVNHYEASIAFRIPGARIIYAPDKREAAALIVQSTWRMLQKRRWLKKIQLERSRAQRVQSAWRAARVINATKGVVQDIRRKRMEDFQALEQQFGNDWMDWQSASARRVEVHIASLPYPTHRKRTMQKFGTRQNAQLGRIFRILDDNVDVVYVSPEPIHPDMVDYVSKIMMFRGVERPSARFQVVVPENINMIPDMSLSTGLAVSPKAIDRIQQLTKNRNAYLVPAAGGPDIIQLSTLLRLPMLGAGADGGLSRGLALSGNRCGTQRLVHLAELPAPPNAVDLYDHKDMFEALSELQLTHRHYFCWVFKIGDEVGCRAHAYIDLSAVKGVRNIVQTVEEVGLENMKAEQVVKDLKVELEKHVPKKVSIANTNAYRTWDEFKSEFFRVGGVIQAVPNGGGVVHATVHIHVDPDCSKTRVIGTSEPIFVPKRPMVKAAHFCPSLHGPYPVLKAVGLRIGQAAGSQGILGNISVDVVFFPNPDVQRRSPQHAEATEDEKQIIGADALPKSEQLFGGLRSPSPSLNQSTASLHHAPSGHQLVHVDLAEEYERARDGMERREAMESQRANDPFEQARQLLNGDKSCEQLMWVVSVSCRMTDEAAALNPMFFTSQTFFDENSGCLRLTPRAVEAIATAKQASGSQAPIETERFSLIAPQALCPGLNKCNYSGVFHAAKMNGLSFDLLANTGLLFNFLDVFQSLVSLISVGRTPQTCVNQLAHGFTVVTDIDRSVMGAEGKNIAVAGADPKDRGFDGLYVNDLQASLRAIDLKFKAQQEAEEEFERRMRTTQGSSWRTMSGTM